jgi:class 3 adenylate cyclase
MTGDRRVDAIEYATRINAAALLVEGGVPVPEAVRALANRWGVSQRQARRYVDQAVGGGRVPVPEPSVVFTVKLPAVLAERVRAHARDRGITISAAVTRALTEFVTQSSRRGRRSR